MKHDEAALQVEIVKALRNLGLFVHSVPNEAAGTNPVRQSQMISMGLFPGVADLVVWLPSGAIGYLEIKSKTGKLSERQERFRIRCEKAGHPYGVARSVSEAISWVSKYAQN